jgi:hypothetical protein
MNQTLHLIGFRGEEYWSAIKVWGHLPVMIHRVHDIRAYRDIGEEDVVLFANKETEEMIRDRNGSDVVGFGYT